MATAGHFTLSSEQRRFKKLLSGYPTLQQYWDLDKRECDVEGLRKAIGSLSHGESVVARFLCAVWLGENTLNFDLIEAAKALDEQHLQVIRNWLNNPFFP